MRWREPEAWSSSCLRLTTQIPRLDDIHRLPRPSSIKRHTRSSNMPSFDVNATQRRLRSRHSPAPSVVTHIVSSASNWMVVAEVLLGGPPGGTATNVPLLQCLTPLSVPSHSPPAPSGVTAL